MSTELEIKLLHVDTDRIIQTLASLRATLVYTGMLRNTIYYGMSQQDNEYLRVRDDGATVTLTYKKIIPNSIATVEHELVVGAYGAAVDLLSVLGFQRKRVDEKYRRRYKLENTFVDIDTWPGMPTYIEIEAPSEQDIRVTCQRLGVSYEDRFVGDTLDIFRYYGIDPTVVTEMIFAESPEH